MKEHTTQAVPIGAAKKLAELAEKYKTDKKDLIGKMIEFFYRTGHNPQDFKMEGSAAAIKTLDKRVVSFFREQENQILKPMRAVLETLELTLLEFRKESPTAKHFDQLLGNQKLLNTKFDEILEERKQ